MDDITKRIDYKDLKSFIDSISYGGKLYSVFSHGDFIFRGHSSDKYELVPSALRTNSSNLINQLALSGSNTVTEFDQIIKEYTILRKFYQICDSTGLPLPNVQRIRATYMDFLDIKTLVMERKWLPEDLWELAALAQHYGIPTRLLDWTHDLYTALYFAVESYMKNKYIPKETKSIVLWALNIKPYANLDMLSCPLKIVHPIYYMNPNMKAQQGLFTLWEITKTFEKEDGNIKINNSKLERKPLDKLLQEYKFSDKIGTLLYQIVIPVDYVKDLCHYLNFLGYNASKIYPGFYGVVKTLQERAYIYEDLLTDYNNVIAVR